MSLDEIGERFLQLCHLLLVLLMAGEEGSKLLLVDDAVADCGRFERLEPRLGISTQLRA